MTLFDYTVSAIIALSILLSIVRGLVREVLSLFSWLAAFWVAATYSVAAIPWLPAAIPGSKVRAAVAFIGVFFAALLLFGLISTLLAQLVKSLDLGALDRGLGAVFGLGKGVVIVTALVFMAGFTPLPQEKFWTTALFSPSFEGLAI